MGKTELGDLRGVLDRRLKLEFCGPTVTSDAGLLAFRELDNALGLTEVAGQVLADCRIGKASQQKMVAKAMHKYCARNIPTSISLALLAFTFIMYSHPATGGGCNGYNYIHGEEVGGSKFFLDLSKNTYFGVNVVTKENRGSIINYKCSEKLMGMYQSLPSDDIKCHYLGSISGLDISGKYWCGKIAKSGEIYDKSPENVFSGKFSNADEYNKMIATVLYDVHGSGTANDLQMSNGGVDIVKRDGKRYDVRCKNGAWGFLLWQDYPVLCANRAGKASTCRHDWDVSRAAEYLCN